MWTFAASTAFSLASFLSSIVTSHQSLPASISLVRWSFCCLRSTLALKPDNDVRSLTPPSTKVMGASASHSHPFCWVYIFEWHHCAICTSYPLGVSREINAVYFGCFHALAQGGSFVSTPVQAPTICLLSSFINIPVHSFIFMCIA